MAENEHKPSEPLRPAKSADASTPDNQSSTDKVQSDTLVKKKISDTEQDIALVDYDEDVESDEEIADDAGADDRYELSSDERLAALIYDDEDDSVTIDTDTDAPVIDIFSIGSMIPKISTIHEPESTSAETTNEVAPVVESEETVKSDQIYPITDPTETDADEQATELVVENADVDPEQIEFDLEPVVQATEVPESNEKIAESSDPSSTVYKKEYDPAHPRFIDTLFDYFELLIFTLVAVMVLTSFVFKHSVVDGGSMDKTLSDGEHLIVYSLFYQPERYDIIVCEDYSTRLKKPIVKRVIALPGEHLVISPDGTVTVDGEELDESGYVYINQSDYVYEPIDIVVPEGEVFVMGDHRNISDDSRSDGIGTIDIDSILGKVVLRIYPFERFGAID